MSSARGRMMVCKRTGRRCGKKAEYYRISGDLSQAVQALCTGCANELRQRGWRVDPVILRGNTFVPLESPRL